MSELPYRLNVGATLFNRDGLVLIGRRADAPAGATHVWQMPQGGIDAGEDPRDAVLRELEEEIGTAHAEILAEHDEWIDYDLPPDLAGSLFGGRYRGQRQRWFALRFLGSDEEIQLDLHSHPEFVEWCWAELAGLPELCVPFKRATYETVVRAFAGFARAVG